MKAVDCTKLVCIELIKSKKSKNWKIIPEINKKHLFIFNEYIPATITETVGIYPRVYLLENKSVFLQDNPDLIIVNAEVHIKSQVILHFDNFKTCLYYNSDEEAIKSIEKLIILSKFRLQSF